MRKGEEKAHLDGYGAGCMFASASSKQPPGVVDRNREAILEADLYAGCWARASVTAFAYDNKGKGVAFGLHNIQKLGEGVSFSGRIAADEDFGDEVGDVFPDSDTGSSDNDADPFGALGHKDQIGLHRCLQGTGAINRVSRTARSDCT